MVQLNHGSSSELVAFIFARYPVTIPPSASRDGAFQVKLIEPQPAVKSKCVTGYGTSIKSESGFIQNKTKTTKNMHNNSRESNIDRRDLQIPHIPSKNTFTLLAEKITCNNLDVYGKRNYAESITIFCYHLLHPQFMVTNPQPRKSFFSLTFIIIHS